MPGVKERPAAAPGGDMNADHVPPQLSPTTDQAKHWMKAHRTMIASSTSSVFSTLSAVSLCPYRSPTSRFYELGTNHQTVPLGLDQDPHASV